MFNIVHLILQKSE